MDVVAAMAVLVSAGVLAVSLAGVLRDDGLRGLTAAVAGMRVVPRGAARAVATLALGAEAVLLVALVAPLVTPLGAAVPLAAAACLFGGYAAALTLAVRRGATTGCHCFGASRSRVAPRHAGRAAALAVLAAAGAAAGAAPGGDGWAVPVDGAGWAVAGPAALVVVALAVRLDDVAWLFGRRDVT